ncbi:hypothetical protein EVAR_62149_1 [Eumeta japonica]|uniref:Uncharacterized protein n=1 Tax=Eumeta variegata TaxID=151549 RepID=A0A4C1ZFZ8_EUMVA|nr:hypothetical protein EVAR_62149_1 [Eumeta japonica]
MDVSQASELYKDRTKWKSVVSAQPSGKKAVEVASAPGGRREGGRVSGDERLQRLRGAGAEVRPAVLHVRAEL